MRHNYSQLVLLTGATGDLGRAVAEAFASLGMSLAIVGGKNLKAARDMALDLIDKYGIDCEAYSFDALQPAAKVEQKLLSLKQTLNKDLGTVCHAVCLAGLKAEPEAWRATLENLDYDLVMRAFQIDVLSSLAVAKVFKKDLIESSGSLTLMSSSAAIYGDTVGLAYAIAKSANAGLTRTLSRVFAPQVRVNAVAPGAIDSKWSKALSQNERKKAAHQSILKALGNPANVASLIVELATNSFVTGQVVSIDGGMFPPSP